MFNKLKFMYVKWTIKRLMKLSHEFNYFINNNRIEARNIFGDDIVPVEKTISESKHAAIVDTMINKPYTGYELAMYGTDPLSLFVKLAAEKTWISIRNDCLPDMNIASKMIFANWIGFNKLYEERKFVVITHDKTSADSICVEGKLFHGTIQEVIDIFKNKKIYPDADESDQLKAEVTLNTTAEYIEVFAKEFAGTYDDYDILNNPNYGFVLFDGIQAKVDDTDEVVSTNSINKSLRILRDGFIRPFIQTYEDIVDTLKLSIDGWELSVNSFDKNIVMRLDMILPITIAIVDKQDGSLLEKVSNVSVLRSR